MKRKNLSFDKNKVYISGSIAPHCFWQTIPTIVGILLKIREISLEFQVKARKRNVRFSLDDKFPKTLIFNSYISVLGDAFIVCMRGTIK